MGYHDGADLPNYWAYATNFVLQDHMFEPNASWSLPAHLFLVSEWSALRVSSTQSDELPQCAERSTVTLTSIADPGVARPRSTPGPT